VTDTDDSTSTRESVTITERTYFSMSHIQAAAHFARLSARLENTKEALSDEVFHEHRAYVTSCVFACVSFMEATINELFSDTVDDGEYAKGLNPAVKTLMADMWKVGVPRSARYSILEKFQIALILCGKRRFDGGNPYQDAHLLIRLRNALVHYEPEWVTTLSESDPSSATIQKLEKKLRGKFTLNPMRGKANVFFPDRCLSYGCANWAIKSSLNFTDSFFRRIELPVPYDFLRPRLVA